MAARQAEVELVDGFLPTIGIECHVQLRTKTKLFAPVAATSGVETPANSSVSPLCLGLPGALPILNQAAVDLAILAGLALEAKIADRTSFDRKHYFYPDLPLGYQISQHWQPIITGGSLEVPTDYGRSFEVGIERAHLEADAGKLSHPKNKDYSLLDLNRVGTPLLEIVSRPEIHSANQAKRYAKELYLRMIYAGVCDGDLFAGNLRFDVNVSVSRKPKVLGTRAEIKNLNSFRFIEQALDYEIKRQIEILKSGGEIIQETRGWQAAAKKTFSQRSKEEAQDYRYMPDPDIPPLNLSPSQIAGLKARLPATPRQVRQRLRDWEIAFATGETLLDQPEVGRLLLKLPADLEAEEAKLICNWLAGDILALAKQRQLDWQTVASRSEQLLAMAAMVRRRKISSAKAKQWLRPVLKEAAEPAELAGRQGESQIADAQALTELIDKVFAENPKAAADARREAKAAGYLVGQVMKASRGNAEPRLTAKLVAERLRQPPA